MSVDFFATPCANPKGNCTTFSLSCLTNIPNARFGISDLDGNNNKPARVDIQNPAIWDLTVINNSGFEVKFKAVDWCVPIFRTGTYNVKDENRNGSQFSSSDVGNELIKRCEGFLQYDNKILFIEIKRRHKNAIEWIEDTREKFEETILSFKEHHPHLANQIVKPILVNPIHNWFAESEKIQKQIMKDKIGIEFVRKNSITI